MQRQKHDESRTKLSPCWNITHRLCSHPLFGLRQYSASVGGHSDNFLYMRIHLYTSAQYALSCQTSFYQITNKLKRKKNNVLVIGRFKLYCYTANNRYWSSKTRTGERKKKQARGVSSGQFLSSKLRKRSYVLDVCKSFTRTLRRYQLWFSPFPEPSCQIWR